MKASLSAVMLLLFVACFPLQAANNPPHNTAIKSSQQSSNTKIDLNKADANILAKSVKGIGQKRAEAIVNYRKEHGHFKSIEELAQVRGFGKQFVKKHLAQLQEVFSIN
jgi:competence protein ComEA